jgi:hypothetical protein
MARPIAPESRTRLLDAAERLFHERGYSAVSMADIADGNRGFARRRSTTTYLAEGGAVRRGLGTHLSRGTRKVCRKLSHKQSEA